MATSDPLARAQDVKRCQLCPGKHRKSAAETVCNTCHVNLCKDCVGHHMTSNPIIRHDVVTFQLKKLEVISPQCKMHKELKCNMFCKGCDFPICEKCLASGSHEKHDVSQISKIHSSRKQLIESDTQELESNIAPVFESILSEIEEMLSHVVHKHGERQQTIFEFGKRCHAHVDIIINRYLSDSKKIANQDRDSIQTLKFKFEKLQTLIQSTIKENHSILASNDLSKFTSYVSRNDAFRNTPFRFELTVPPLDLSELTEQALTQFIGVIPTSIKTDIPGQVLQVTHPVSNIKKPDRELLGRSEVLTALPVGYTNTYRVCCIPDTDQFYVRGDNNIIKHINTEGTLLGEIMTKSGKYRSYLTVTKEGDLVYTDWGDRSINKQKDGKIECLIRLKGWRPRAICSTSTNDLLVTMMSDDGPSKIARYSGSTVLQEIRYGNKTKPLYSDPAFVTENKNLNIVVSDHSKTVVVVNKEGKFRFNYKRNIQLKERFTPCGVTTDSMSHILIADRDNHVIHIIDQNGQFLQYIDNCNLQLAYDLSTDSNGMLLVAEFKTGIVKKIQYLE